MNFIYINKKLSLKTCISNLSERREIAIDLEFDKNRFRYGFNLCLMQIYDGTDVYLIDPLADEIDISLLFSVLENPEITKISFSFSEDIRLLHTLGCFPKGIYDVQFASSLLDYPPTSLTKLLDEILDVQVGKSSQQSNWFARPLSDQQKNYAAEDVLYLPALKNKLEAQLKQRGLQDWVKQENEFFEASNFEDIDHNIILKEKYKGKMTEWEWHIFAKLMELRDQWAQQINRPPYHIAERSTLQEIAEGNLSPGEWNQQSSNHRTTKNSTKNDELRSLIKHAEQEASNLQLSKTKRASKRLNRDEYEEYRVLEERVKFYKSTYFKPIQDCIEQKLGSNAKTFILSNRLIREIAEGKIETILPYKRALFIECAEKNNLDIQSIISTNES